MFETTNQYCSNHTHHWNTSGPLKRQENGVIPHWNGILRWLSYSTAHLMGLYSQWPMVSPQRPVTVMHISRDQSCLTRRLQSGSGRERLGKCVEVSERAGFTPGISWGNPSEDTVILHFFGVTPLVNQGSLIQRWHYWNFGVSMNLIRALPTLPVTLPTAGHKQIHSQL